MTPDFMATMRRQYGVVTRRQATRANMSAHAIRRRLETGEWDSLAKGVYRSNLVPDIWEGRLLACCLATGGLASHRSAARLHRLEGFVGSHVEVSVRRGHHVRYAGAVVHQSAQLDRAGRVERNGVPCTGLARTVLDLGAVLPPSQVRSLVVSVIGQGRLQWRHLFDVLARHSSHGRNGCGVLRTVLTQLDAEKRVPLSVWSLMVADRLEAFGLPRPEMEYEVFDASGIRIGFVDLVYPHHRIAIELDSRRWHDNPAATGNGPIRSDWVRDIASRHCISGWGSGSGMGGSSGRGLLDVWKAEFSSRSQNRHNGCSQSGAWTCTDFGSN